MPLAAEDRRRLLDLARRSIRAAIAGEPAPRLDAPSDPLAALTACFVTLRVRATDELRGCIGQTKPVRPLHEAVADAAVAAAIRDPRFPPLALNELAGLTIDISVLGPFEPIRGPDEVQVGRDGLFLRRGDATGLLLPQVAPEFGWDAPRFVEQVCRKADLPREAWKAPDAELFRFTAEVFGEAPS